MPNNGNIIHIAVLTEWQTLHMASSKKGIFKYSTKQYFPGYWGAFWKL